MDEINNTLKEYLNDIQLEDAKKETESIGNVKIGKNSLRYRRQYIKISSIARTWLHRYPNKAKMDFEYKLQIYEQSKQQYEQNINSRINSSIASLQFAVIVLVPVTIGLFRFGSYITYTIGALFIVIVIILLFMIYSKKKRKINVEYPYEAPKCQDFPEKYGLGIELNSKFSFLIPSYDIEFLRMIEQRIHNSTMIPENKEYTFNLNTNNWQIEKFDVEKVESVTFNDTDVEEIIINEES